MQVVLEGAGELVLQELAQGLQRRGNAWADLASRLLAQEDAHRRFGARALQRMARSGRTGPAALQAAAAEYLALATAMLHGSQATFAELDSDMASYTNALASRVHQAITPMAT